MSKRVFVILIAVNNAYADNDAGMIDFELAYAAMMTSVSNIAKLLVIGLV